MADRLLPTFDEVRQLIRYEPETGRFIWLRRDDSQHEGRRWNTRHAGKDAGTIKSEGYREIHICGRLHKAHRLAWLLETGSWPKNQIDHINRVRSDNRFSNLRQVSNSENAQNRKLAANNTTGYTGVYKYPGFWIARIKLKGEAHHLGSFNSAEEAALAYKDAKKRLHPMGR